ncbi:hypothetical protein BDZ89DRAFT_1071529 [Hymenopellis radicata]|nr:hypothetical protein BDZ89DRAFT_1071529 [Hymenopellis radicata]
MVDAAMLKFGLEYTSGCRLCRYDKRGTEDGDSMTRSLIFVATMSPSRFPASR